MASIRKRGDLQWEARVRRKGWPVACKTFTTKADAEKWVRETEGKMDRGVFISQVEAERLKTRIGWHCFAFPLAHEKTI